PAPRNLPSFPTRRSSDLYCSLRQRADRGDDLRVERRADARGIEAQRLPLESQESRDDRSRGDAGDPGEPGEERQLVDPPEGPQVKQHGAIAATREAQRDAVL